MNLIDPTTINPVNNPKLVFTSQPGIVSDLIELRENGSWGVGDDVSHMMTMTQPLKFNCQDPSGFVELPVSAYMTPGTNIIFVSLVNMTPLAYNAMCLLVAQKLGKQSYDWLQILGQAIGLDFLHMPGTEDCSEEGVRELKGIAKYLTDGSIITTLPNQSNPQQVLQFCLDNPKDFSLDGHYQA